MTPFNCYHWSDFKTEICNNLGIDPAKFRRYEATDGGCHDLHRTITGLLNDDFQSRTVSELFKYGYDGELDPHWTKPVIDAYNKVIDDIDPTDSGVYVIF